MGPGQVSAVAALLGQGIASAGVVGSMVDAEAVVFVLIGLLGGAHCLGMCGPLVTIYAENMDAVTDTSRLTWYEIRQHFLFNSGRTLSYLVLGGLFGLVGSLTVSAVDVGTVGSWVRGVMGVVVGVLIIVVGLRRLAGRQTDPLAGVSIMGNGAFRRVYTLLSNRVSRWSTGPAIVGLGALHGLLPCPILYPAFLYAFSQGAPVQGAYHLGLLGLGTFPTLFVYGTVIQSVGARRRERAQRALGALFLVLGYIPLAHGLALLGVPVPRIRLPIFQPLS